MNSKIDAKMTSTITKISWRRGGVRGAFQEATSASAPSRGGYVLGSILEPFSAKNIKKTHPKINAKIDTVKVSENVAIEFKRGPTMRPK